MTLSEPIWLGSLAVFGACVLFVCKPTSVFGRALTFEEAALVCWVAHSIYIGTVAVYLALKFQFGISRAANAPATAIAACASVLIILYLVVREQRLSG
jgi:hypothetical protein